MADRHRSPTPPPCSPASSATAETLEATQIVLQKDCPLSTVLHTARDLADIGAFAHAIVIVADAAALDRVHSFVRKWVIGRLKSNAGFDQSEDDAAVTEFLCDGYQQAKDRRIEVEAVANEAMMRRIADHMKRLKRGDPDGSAEDHEKRFRPAKKPRTAPTPRQPKVDAPARKAQLVWRTSATECDWRTVDIVVDEDVACK